MTKLRASKETLHGLRALGMSDAAIAKAYRVNRERIGQVLGRRSKRSSSHPAGLSDVVCALWRQGLSQRQIAENIGVSPISVAGIRHRYRHIWGER